MAPLSRDERGVNSENTGAVETPTSSPGKSVLISRKAKRGAPLAEDPHAPEDKKRRKDHTPNTAELDAHGPEGVEDEHDGEGGHPDAEAAGGAKVAASPGGEHAAHGAAPAESAAAGDGGATSARATEANAAASAGPAANDQGITVHRKAASAGSIEGAHAGAVLDRAQASSTGAPLGPEVRGQMEAGFGQSFADVRVHTDASAGEAAQGLNAHAFAAGNDIFFDKGSYDPGSKGGQHLLAHELAHVVQGGGAAAKATGEGVSVSAASDAHEIEADAAAATVVSGGTVTGLGSTAPAIHRDALGDLDATSQGNWIGNVDGGEAIRRAGALSDADKRRLATEARFQPTIRRLAGAFNANEMMQLFAAVPYFEVRWKIYWLVISGAINGLNQTQWRAVIGTATPQDMDALRQYPTGYRAFTINAPDDVVPPWDRLQALKSGWWAGDPARVRFAVNSLSTAQRTTVRGDDALTRAIVTHAGTPTEVFRVITYLAFPLKWAVNWLNQASALPALTPQQWSQMLAEAPKAEFDELVGWPEMWALVQRLCPPGLLQVVRQNTTDPNAITTQLTDPVALGLLWTSLGPAGLLALVTQPGTDVAVNYNHLKTASNKHLDVLNGLERGMRQGERTSANLKKWFDPATGENTVTTLELMATVRFNLTVGAGGGAGPVTGGPGGPHGAATLAHWTVQGLRMAWQIMERLPPAMVESNPAFLYLIMNSANNGGYYAGRDTSAGWDNSAVIGLQGPTGAVMAGDAVYGGTMPQFNQVLRHEIGHAVDNQLTIVAAIQSQPWAGAWVNHGTPANWVAGLIAAGGGLGTHGYPATDVGDYLPAMVAAATNGTLFLTELNTIRAAKTPALPPVAAAPATGPVAVLNDLRAWHYGSSFWSANVWKPQGGRNFVRAYRDQNHWWSFADAKLTQKATDYQFRAPKEWFADAYAVYYTETETGPNVPVGGLLRSKDAAAADFISAQVDRGHSPQLMVGGGTNAAPGTPGGVGGHP